MTYFLVDGNGDFVCDLATSIGLEEIEEKCPEIADGEFKEVEPLAKALESLGRNEDAELVRKAKPPLIVTDGVIEE